MKRTPVIFVLALGTLVFGLVGQVGATASTHIWGPSTDIQAYKLVHITTDMYLPVEDDAGGSRIPSVTNLGLTVGVLPFKALNMEVGFDHKSGLGMLDRYPLYANAKIGLPENAFGGVSPAIAVGILDVGTKADLTDFNVIYGKVAKTISAGRVSLGRFSVGYFVGNDELLLDGDGEKDNAGVLLAWERVITEWTDKLWVCAEYMGTKSAYGTFNVGLSWKFAPNVAVLGGVDFFNNGDLPATGTVQVDIDF
jgi:hypothetical protein